MPIPLQPKRPTISHFYKYSKPEHLNRLKDIILKSELYFPTPKELKDPAEGKPKLADCSLTQIVSMIQRNFIKNNPSLSSNEVEKNMAIIAYNAARFGTEALLREISRILNSELQHIHIYSLTKRYDNMCLWETYAHNHTGYCMEFANDGLFAYSREVIYDDTVAVDVTNPTQLDAFFVFYKSKDYIIEEEFRIVTPRCSNTVIKQFDPKLLTRVILGMHMKEEHRVTIRSWAQQRRPELVVVSAHYDELHHKLVIKH